MTELKRHRRECPHCKAPITVKQAVEILNGTGIHPRVHIKLDDGTAHLMNACDVNPNTMQIIDDVLSSAT